MISDKGWSGRGGRGGGGLSGRVMGKVRPQAPLKSRLDTAQAQLGMQIAKLDAIHASLRKKHEAVFSRIVKAQAANNHGHARAYAVELAEMRKITDMVGGARLALDQVRVRMSTVAEMGDIVVTLSPCLSVIKGLNGALGGMMPEASSSMNDFAKVLGDVLSGSSVGSAAGLNSLPGAGHSHSEAASAIMDEAHAVVEGRAKDSLPDLPASLKGDVLRQRAAYT